MRKFPILIYKSSETDLPTASPVFFYGMPDNRVYAVYSKQIKTISGGIRYEYNVALLEEYSFDYEKGVLFRLHTNEKKPLYPESFIDKYNPKLKTIRKLVRSKNILTFDFLIESFLKKSIKSVFKEPIYSY